MTIASIDCPSCHLRPGTATALWCLWHVYAGFYPQQEQRNRYQCVATEPTTGMGIVVARDFADLNQKDTTQIPIAVCLP
jgi:cytochrome c